MSRFSPIAFGLALPVTFLSQMALADLTPTDVWGDWRGYMEGMGYKIEGTENTSGGDLKVSAINLSFALPENGGELRMSLGDVEFNQNRNGSVSIVMPENMPISIAGKSELDDEEFNLTLNYSQTGHEMTASGSPEAMTYLYTAQTVAMNLAQIQVGDESLSQEFARISFEGTNISSSTSMTIGDIRGYDQTSSIDSMSYDFFFKDPESTDTQGAIKGTASGVSMSGTGTMPRVIAPGADMATLLSAGFAVTGKISYAEGGSVFDIKDPENGNYVMTSSTKGGNFGVKMGAGGLAYDVSQRDLSVGVTMEAMPFPFEIKMAESGFNLAMPVSKSDDHQDFAFGLKMDGFTMSDIIWSMFDPSGQLPRDPATVIVDLTGKAKLLVDWMNPEAIEQLDSSPGEVKALNLGNLLVAAAGAKLEGSGDITFDGSGPAMVPGIGNPVGDVHLFLAGGNGLLDKLVAMGFLPQDQAMGARMMMGLFAVAGDAPDTLKSKIEFTQDGQILANGQRLR